MLVNIVANLAGKARKATLNGRRYLVVPVVMIVPGVLSGSYGPLLYPEEEVSRNVDSWNGIPITVRHPTVNGQPVSINAPGIRSRFAVGHLYAARYNGQLEAEAWIDIELATKIDIRILNALLEGRSIEVSTGLFTQNYKAKPGSHHKGRPYLYIARNYRPDHLALLPDETGACSLKDGCGIRFNSLSNLSTPIGASPVNKEQKIAWLIANCSCWKGTNDQTILNSFDETKLDQLINGVQQSQQIVAQHQGVINTLTTGFVVNGVKVTFDQTTGQFKGEQLNPTPTPTPNPQPQVIEFKPVGQSQPTLNRTKSFLELLNEVGTEEEKTVWNTAVQVVETEKKNLIEQLVANTIADQKATAQAVYNSMKIDDLRKLAAAQKKPTAPKTINGAPVFDLNAGGSVQNHTPVNRTGLSLPVTKFDNPLVKKN